MVSEAFQILGCHPGDSLDTLKRAYKNLVKEYHPDCIRAVGGSPEMIAFADQEFRKLDNAYRYLKDIFRGS